MTNLLNRLRTRRALATLSGMFLLAGCSGNAPNGTVPGFTAGGSGGEGGTKAVGGSSSPNAGGSSGAASTAPTFDAAAQVALGSRFSCARARNGNVKCWGQNGGWLGLGDYQDRGSKPEDLGTALPVVSLGNGAKATSLIANQETICAMLEGGAIKCWGNNSDGQLGQGDMLSRGGTLDEMGDALKEIDFGSDRSLGTASVGAFHNCVLLKSRQLACWGGNSFGELGLGDTAARGDEPLEMGSALPTLELGAGRTATIVAAGQRHSCALLDDQSVKCWGENSDGELGLGDMATRGDEPSEMGDNLKSVDLGGGVKAIAVFAGPRYSCAILSDRRVKCWGANEFGQLGNGDYNGRGTFAGSMGDALPYTDLGSDFEANSLALGADHACVLSVKGTIKCWGSNDAGQQGQGNREPLNVPPPVAVSLGSGRQAAGVAVGEGHSCAVLDDGQIKCWGNNSFGQLGLGDVANRGDEPNEMGDSLSTVRL